MRILSTERTIVGGFGLALVVLCVVAGVSIWLTLALLNDLEQVSTRVKVLDKIGQANVTLPQMASTARLYGVERRDETFAEWQAHTQEFKNEMKELSELTKDSSSQQVRVQEIMRLLKWKEMATTPDRTRGQIFEIWSVNPKGISAMMPIASQLTEMTTEERTFLALRNEQAARGALAALWTIGVASLLAVILVAGAVAVIMRDLRARRKAADELEIARQTAVLASMAKSAFLANMSHELRTPLTSIMGYADLMMAPDISSAKQQEYLQTMRRSGEHLLTLINDILDVSKIEAGRMNVEKIECRTLEVLADVDSLMRSRAKEKGIEFALEYSTAIPDRIKTDPTRFRQILMNLVGNAVKFTDEGGVHVVVSYDQQLTLPPHEENGSPTTTNAADVLTIKVVDTGVGISEEQQKLLFQPFMQADISTTRRFGGTGLGLSISRRLARMLGGELTMHSEVARGSTFILSLALDPVPGTEMLPPGHARQMVAGIGRNLEPMKRDLGVRVLLAEDGPENRDVIMLHLRHAGCEVTAAEDGEQAYDLALQALSLGEPFEVILMDMQMPVMDGYTATSKLRASGYTGVIIALTAHAMKEDRDRCLRVGCDEYAAKPVDMPALLQMISRFCGRPGRITVTQKLVADPVLRTLTRKFCDGMPDTLDKLKDSAQRSAWEELAGVAHKLAGTGGAYGFEEITREAKALERKAQSRAPYEELEVQLARLEAECRRAKEMIEETHISQVTASVERQ